MILKEKKFKKYSVIIEDDENDITIKIVANNINSDEIGSISFKFNYQNRSVWIYKIEIKKEFQSQGFGDMLIEIFEAYCQSKRFFQIEGKFYPENDHAKPFYEKHGYQIDKEYYDTFISKNIEMKNEILQKDFSF